MKIFKSKPESFIDPDIDLHNFRFFGEEAEVLGQRMDAARAALNLAQTSWAKWYWRETLDRLLYQWRQLPILHDAEAKVTMLPRWTVDYDFFERHYGSGADIGDKIFDYLRGDANFDRSWEMVRAERLAKCHC